MCAASSSPGARRWPAALVVLAACGPPAAVGPPAGKLPAGAIVHWHVSQGLWGTEDLTIDRGGATRYRFAPVKGRPESPKDATAHASPAELGAIERAATANDLCTLESGRLGVPDEGKPTLFVSLGAVSCSVTLWDGEWRDDARAAAVLATLRPLFQRVGASLP